MTTSHYFLLFIVLIGLGSGVALALGRRRRPASRGNLPRLRGHLTASEPRASLRRLCDVAASALDGHVAIIADRGGRLRILAAAPRIPQLQTLDLVAAEWALAHCIPAGSGAGVMAASDWQFQPILCRGMLCGLLAIAGRGGREPVLPHQRWLLEDILREAATALDRLTPSGSANRSLSPA